MIFRSLFALQLDFQKVFDMESESIEALIAALGDRIKCDEAAVALVNIGDAAVEPLIVALNDSYWPRRRNAAEALGRIGNERAVEALIAALNDEKGDVCNAVVLALGQVGGINTIEP